MIRLEPDVRGVCSNSELMSIVHHRNPEIGSVDFGLSLNPGCEHPTLEGPTSTPYGDNLISHRHFTFCHSKDLQGRIRDRFWLTEYDLNALELPMWAAPLHSQAQVDLLAGNATCGMPKAIGHYPLQSGSNYPHNRTITA